MPVVKTSCGPKKLHLGFSAADMEIYALVDTNFLDRIISNLLSNAIKYTEEGSVKVTVGREDDMIAIKVKDTGIGIDKGFLPLLFEPFRQEHMGDNRPYEGVGLGLSITKRLIDLMEGDIILRVHPRRVPALLYRSSNSIMTFASSTTYDHTAYNILVNGSRART